MRPFSNLLIALFLACGTVPAYSAAPVHQGSIVVQAPVETVFFATDREAKERDALKFAGQSNDPPDQITFGAASSDDSGAATRTFQNFDGMADDIAIALAQSERKEVVIFVHGCCVNFKDAIRQAAQLRSETKAPVIMYDWGSPLSYSGSILANPRSQERFNIFMKGIVRRFQDKQVSLVGLSMGGILMDNFFMQHRPAELGKKFHQVVFARADMDSVMFRTHIPKISEHAEKLFVYADSQDPMINLSNFLRKLASPVLHGDRVGRLAAGLFTEHLIRVIDVTPLQLKHLLPVGVIADMLASNGAKPADGQYNYVEQPNGSLQVQPKFAFSD
jgi:esterase/lipase superfamily enzyme